MSALCICVFAKEICFNICGGILEIIPCKVRILIRRLSFERTVLITVERRYWCLSLVNCGAFLRSALGRIGCV